MRPVCCCGTPRRTLYTGCWPYINLVESFLDPLWTTAGWWWMRRCPLGRWARRGAARASTLASSRTTSRSWPPRWVRLLQQLFAVSKLLTSTPCTSLMPDHAVKCLKRNGISGYWRSMAAWLTRPRPFCDTSAPAQDPVPELTWLPCRECPGVHRRLLRGGQGDRGPPAPVRPGLLLQRVPAALPGGRGHGLPPEDGGPPRAAAAAAGAGCGDARPAWGGGRAGGGHRRACLGAIIGCRMQSRQGPWWLLRQGCCMWKLPAAISCGGFLIVHGCGLIGLHGGCGQVAGACSPCSARGLRTAALAHVCSGLW